jgi:hypothetical protein
LIPPGVKIFQSGNFSGRSSGPSICQGQQKFNLHVLVNCKLSPHSVESHVAGIGVDRNNHAARFCAGNTVCESVCTKRERNEALNMCMIVVERARAAKIRIWIGPARTSPKFKPKIIISTFKVLENHGKSFHEAQLAHGKVGPREKVATVYSKIY